MNTPAQPASEPPAEPPLAPVAVVENAMSRVKLYMWTAGGVTALLAILIGFELYGLFNYQVIPALEDALTEHVDSSLGKAIHNNIEEAVKPFSSGITSLNEATTTLSDGLGMLEQSLAQLDDRTASTSAILNRVAVLLGATEPPRPKAVFLVLPRGVRTPSWDGSRKVSVASFDMRLGFLQAAGWDAEPTRISQDDDLFTVAWSLRLVVPGQDGQPSVEDIQIVQISDDEDVERTINAIRRAEQKYECLLAIGHSDSTKARKVCERYYLPNHIPFILLGPTNPEITEAAQEVRDAAFLRLLPTDRQQVDELLQVLLSNPTWLDILFVGDRKNKDYSDWIINRVEQLIDESDRTNRQKGPRHTVRSFLVGTDDPATDVARFARTAPDVVVFVGLSESGIELVRHWNDQWSARQQDKLQRPTFIFTDGCTSAPFSDFLMHNRAAVGDALLLSPMPPRYGSEHDDSVSIDFTPLGMVASALVTRILEDSAKDHGVISRDTCRKQIQWLMHAPRLLVIRVDRPGTVEPFSVPAELKTFWFRAKDATTVDGDNLRWRYHFYLLGRDSSRFKHFDSAAAVAEAIHVPPE